MQSIAAVRRKLPILIPRELIVLKYGIFTVILILVFDPRDPRRSKIFFFWDRIPECEY